MAGARSRVAVLPPLGEAARRAAGGAGIRIIHSAPAHRVNTQNLTLRLPRSGRWLMASDALALILAFAAGGFLARTGDIHLFRGSFQPFFSHEMVRQFIVFAGLGALALLWFDWHGHYRQRLPFWETAGNLLAAVTIGLLVCGFVRFLHPRAFSRLWLMLSWALFGLFLGIGRSGIRRWLEHRGEWKIPALVIGEGAAAEAARQALAREHTMGFEVIAQVPAGILRVLTHPQGWQMLMRSHHAGHLLLALEGGEWEEHQAALKSLVHERLPYSVVPAWHSLPAGTLSPHYFTLHDVMLLHDAHRLHLPLPRFLKRGFDIAGASLGLLIALPLFFLPVALFIRRDGGPVFFTQERVGKNGRRFPCYKFRSMHVDAEEILEHYLAQHSEIAAEWQQFQKLREDVRVTAIGRFLRRTSLDELPQLFNVLRGEMSLVGPRPIMPGQEHYYEDDYPYYESVRPGLTGPWQVCGRNSLTFKQRALLESSYVRNWTLWMDIVIILKTFSVLLKKDQAF